MNGNRWIVGSARVSLAALFACGVSLLVCGAAPAGQKAKHSFGSVQEILEAKCVSCHNDKQHPEGVDLTSYDKLMKGGESGPIVVPGHPEKSKLVLYIDGSKQPRMPFKQPPLSKKDVNTVMVWVKSGAKK